MPPSSIRPLCVVCCGLAAILGFGSSSVRAEDPGCGFVQSEVQALVERLNRLEERNQELEQALTELRRQLDADRPAESSGAPAEFPAPPPLQPDAVKQLVTEYLQQKGTGRADTNSAGQGKGYEVGSDLSMIASWRDGFTVETPNKDFRLHLGGRFQADTAWFAPDANLEDAFPGQWNDGADFRRLRLRADGSAWEVFDFVLEIEFSQGIQGTTNHPFPTDVFLDFKNLPVVQNISVGHYKEPFSLQDYGTPDSYGVWMERGVDDAFTPDRNLGIMWHGSYFDQSVILATGVFRTNSDGRSGNAFDYGDGEYAYTGRCVFVPYYEADGRCWLLFGPAYSHRVLDPDDAGLPDGDANPSRARFNLRPPIRVNSPVLVDTGRMEADHFDLYNLQAGLNLGPLLLQGEYYNAQVHNVRRGLLAPGEPRLLNPAFYGWYVQASCFLTGEYHPLDRKWGRLARVRPNEPYFFVRRGDKGCFDGFCHGLGAWEVAVRYDYAKLTSRALGPYPGTPGVPDSGVEGVATAGYEQDLTFGINWYLNPQMRIEANYAHVFRAVADPAQNGDVDILGLRLWFDF